MPHVPRRYANTTGTPPELTPEAVAQHPAIPIRQDAQEEQKPARLKLSLGKMNIRTWEPDFKQVYRTMFGRDPEIDPYTQQLISPPQSESTF